ncbi:MAG: DISARM system helicase DrmA [Gemmatimonadota bacterium]
MTQTSVEVRDDVVRALRLDLVGPMANLESDAKYASERLPMSPSRWYLTGFLVPSNAPDEQRSDEASQEEMDLAGDSDIDGDEDVAPEKGAAKRLIFPASIGLSVLIPEGTDGLDAVITWGDYVPEPKASAATEGGEVDAAVGAVPIPRDQVWVRTPRSQSVRVPISAPGSKSKAVDVPGSGGIKLYSSARNTGGGATGLKKGTQSVAVFLVNERTPEPTDEKDRAFIFQAKLELTCNDGFVPRPDPRRGSEDDWDDKVADVQYADVFEYATGHGVSADWSVGAKTCTRAWTTWTPCANVPFVEPADMPEAMLEMQRLATVSGDELTAGLTPLVQGYSKWIELQRSHLPEDEKRKATATNLLSRATTARDRMQRGISLLDDDTIRRAFQLANLAMDEASRRRVAQRSGQAPGDVKAPAWRPFQLAFVLLNMAGIANPADTDREIVDLLFFPTGGGKTEAYLGLAAFTLILRRLRQPTVASAGVTVLMRYTLRLLTLDQLGRAASLICALERIRWTNTDSLGPWPFEIGLWVGRAATPNRMGKTGDQDESTARKRVQAYQQNSRRKPAPIPIESCPWCGTAFTRDSYDLRPNANHPIDLRILCVNTSCEFSGERALPIVAVDEPLYRRLPCFVIATVDKFASLPFEARAGALFGLVDRHDQNGFYGAADPGVGNPIPGGRLQPPELIIQDELHLISGPLGTIAGLYEAAIDRLATREQNGAMIRPKIVASTATVRRAEKQVRALFARRGVELFPPASANRDDSFFALTAPTDRHAPRQYIGLAAPGRSLKVVMLRAYIALLGASYRAYKANGADRFGSNPADPYLTLLGYFSALRELGGARRIIEDEVNSRLRIYGDRKRVGEQQGLFEDRDIEYEVLELTSRKSTSDVARAKQRLEHEWRLDNKGERVDVAIATNMISVGLDISRLGLMVVAGQPRGSAEYIQSTSRVGRLPTRPGLVVTLLTTNKPRDRSHYERFGFYHRTFYRSVEATSVTPFAPRAVDRVLPALVVALARHMVKQMTPARAAIDIDAARPQLGFILDTLAERVEAYDHDLDAATREEMRLKLRGLASELLDDWSRIAKEQHDTGSELKYQQYERVERAQPLLWDPLDPRLAELSAPRGRFKAARSMRDVEPEVLLLKRGSRDGT